MLYANRQQLPFRATKESGKPASQDFFDVPFIRGRPVFSFLLNDFSQKMFQGIFNLSIIGMNDFSQGYGRGSAMPILNSVWQGRDGNGTFISKGLKLVTHGNLLL